MELTKKYFNLRQSRFCELPDTIFIETVMGCNLRCEMCPVPQSKLKMNGRGATMMSLETFHRILGGIEDKPRKLSLNQMGEPLLNPLICDFVSLSKKAGHKTFFTSNGTLMTDSVARKLLIAGLDHVTFSIDGYYPTTYESIRIGANYEKVRSNVDQFCRLRKEVGANTTVQIDCILSDVTRNEIGLMQKYWQGKVDSFNVILLDNWAGQYTLPSKFGWQNTRAMEYVSGGGGGRYPCDLLWTTMAISAEGFVMYCCHDYKLLSRLPNVNEIALGKIWEDIVSKERRKHVEQKIDADPCLHCLAWRTREPYFAERSLLVRRLAGLMPPKYRILAKRIVCSLTRGNCFV